MIWGSFSLHLWKKGGPPHAWAETWATGQRYGCPWGWLEEGMLADGGIGRWVIAEGKEVISGAWKKKEKQQAKEGRFLWGEGSSCLRKTERGSFLELGKFPSLNALLHHLIIYVCYFIVCCGHQWPQAWFWLNMVVCTRCSVFFVSLWYLCLYMHGHHHPHAPHTCSIYAFIPCPPCIPHFFF